MMICGCVLADKVFSIASISLAKSVRKVRRGVSGGTIPESFSFEIGELV
jgi:hypothetical protein